MKGGDLAFRRMSLPLYHHGRHVLWGGGGASSRSPSTDWLRAGATDTPEMEKNMPRSTGWCSALFQLD